MKLQAPSSDQRYLRFSGTAVFNAEDAECLAEGAEEKVVFSAPFAKISASSAVNLKRRCGAAGLKFPLSFELWILSFVFGASPL